MASYRKLKSGWKVTVSKRVNGKLKQISKNGFSTKNRHDCGRHQSKLMRASAQSKPANSANITVNETVNVNTTEKVVDEKQNSNK